MIENLFTVEYKDDDKAVIKLCGENHPVFKAHFPGSPILPGFINFEIVALVFGIEITQIKRAKFLKLIHPNETVKYIKKGNSFKVFCKDEEVASFQL